MFKIIFIILVVITGCFKHRKANTSDFIEVVALGTGVSEMQNANHQDYRIAHYLRFEFDSDNLFIMFDDEVDEDLGSRRVNYRIGVLRDKKIRDDIIKGLNFIKSQHKNVLQPTDFENTPRFYSGYTYYLNYMSEGARDFVLFETIELDTSMFGLVDAVRGLNSIRDKELIDADPFFEEDTLLAAILAIPEFTRIRPPQEFQPPPFREQNK